MEIERTSMQNTLETTNLLAQRLQQQVTEQKAEIVLLQGENKRLTGLQTSAQNLEVEKKALERKVSELEHALSQSHANANITGDSAGDNMVAKMKADKEASDSQIDFLNSVIVDIQRKNDELTLRLQAMESGVINGAEEEMDLSMGQSRVTAPRLFCDICDVFDLHDTDDCPQQMSDSPPATQHHGERHAQRAYCDICEVFGHSTEDCDDEQTF